MGVFLANQHYLSEGPNALGVGYVLGGQEGCQRGFTEFQRIGRISSDRGGVGDGGNIRCRTFEPE